MVNNTIMHKAKVYMNYIQAVVFVGVYIALGFVLNMNPNLYLLLGIPLTMLFQLGVRKQPLYTLWVRNSTSFRLNKIGIALAIAFMAEPVREIILMVIHKKADPIIIAYLIAAIAGAFGTAFSFMQFKKD